MVIDEFDFMRVAVMPTKAYSVLIIHPDAELSGAIALKFLESVSWRHAQIHQVHCFVQIRELSTSDILNVAAEHFHIVTFENISSVFAREA